MDHEAQQPEEEEDGLKGIAMAEEDWEGGRVPPKSPRVAPLWCGELWSAARRTVTSASWPNGIREQSEAAVGQGGQHVFCLGRSVVHHGRTRKHCQLYRSCRDLDSRQALRIAWALIDSAGGVPPPPWY